MFVCIATTTDLAARTHHDADAGGKSDASVLVALGDVACDRNDGLREVVLRHLEDLWQ